MATIVLTIHELRQRWKPHKERLSAVRDDHPTPIRFHRACSWLEGAERLKPEGQLDQVLVHQWIAFNALYGQWDSERHEPVADRESWKVFLGRVLELDESGYIIMLLTEHKGLVASILGNAYLNRYFWQEPSGENVEKAGRGGKHRAELWYAQKTWSLVLEQLVERIYCSAASFFTGRRLWAAN